MTTTGEETTPAAFCSVCGHPNPGGANFCSSCGAALHAEGEDLTVTFTSGEGLANGDVTVHLEDFFAQPAVLVVKRGGDAGTTYSLSEATTVAGRSPDTAIFLDDVTVSRRHAEFVRSANGYSVRDSGSLNGTYVNRERVTEAVLHNGDEVQIGKFRLVFLSGVVAERRATN